MAKIEWKKEGDGHHYAKVGIFELCAGRDGWCIAVDDEVEKRNMVHIASGFSKSLSSAKRAAVAALRRIVKPVNRALEELQ